MALVWALVLAKPVVSLILGSPHHLLELEAPVAPSVATAEVAKPKVTQYVIDLEPRQDHGQSQDIDSRALALPAVDRFEQRSAQIAPTTSFSWPKPDWAWLGGVWLFGVVVMLFRSARARIQLARILAAGKTPSATVTASYEKIAVELAVRKRPRLLLTEAIESPALVGLLRPSILLPVWLVARLEHGALEWSLRHELTHWRHGDPWLVRVRELAEICFYFHPAAWWVGRRMEEAMETACDRAVVASEADASDYAQRLYQILAEVRERRRTVLAGGLFATRTQIKGRLQVLVQSPLRTRPRLSNWAAAGIIAISASVLAVGAGVRRDARADNEQVKTATDIASEKKPDGAKSSDNAIVLHFPADRSVGILHTRPWRDDGYTFLSDGWKAPWKRLGEVRGDVRIEPDLDVRLDVNRAASTDLTFLDQLPPRAIRSLMLGDTEVNDENLHHVGRLIGLKRLELSSTPVTDAGIVHLAPLVELAEIRLDAFSTGTKGFGVGDGALAILSKIPTLAQLDLRLTKVTDAGMRHLANMHSLRSICISGTPVTDAGLTPLKDLKDLDCLDLGIYREGKNFTDEALANVAGLTKLRWLRLGGSRVTDRGLAHLKDMKRLEHLELGDTQVTDAGLAYLEPLTSLKEVGLPDRITDEGATHLSRVASLERIRSNFYHLSDDGVRQLSKLDKLQGLNLGGNTITNASFAELAKMKGLKTLSMQDCDISDAGLIEYCSAPLPAESVETILLTVEPNKVTAAALRAMANLRKLSDLALRFHAKSVNDEISLAPLAELKQLKHLDIDGDSIVEDDLVHVGKLDGLEEFESQNLPISDAGLARLAGLESLKNLTLYDTRLSDAGLAHLVGFKKLEHLNLSGPFSDRGLDYLAHLPDLAWLQVAGPGVTDEGLAELAKTLPALQGVNRFEYREGRATSSKKASRFFEHQGTLAERIAKAQAECRREYLRPLVIVANPADVSAAKLIEICQLDWRRPLDCYEKVIISADDAGAIASLGELLGEKAADLKAPALVVLSDDGKPLATLNLPADTPALRPAIESGRQFLETNALPPLDAQALLDGVLEQAGREGKRIFLQDGSPWCGPCRRLTRFIDERRAIFDKHFVYLKISRPRFTHSEEVIARFRPQDGGIPWHAILDADAKVLATSNRPEGDNIGFPGEPPSIDHFLKMLSTAPGITADELARLRSDLEARAAGQ